MMLSRIDPLGACGEPALQRMIAETIMSEDSANCVDMGPQCGHNTWQVVMGAGYYSGVI